MPPTIHNHRIEVLTIFGYCHLNHRGLRNEIGFCFAVSARRRARLENQVPEKVCLPKIGQVPKTAILVLVVFLGSFDLPQPTGPQLLQIRFLGTRNDYVLIGSFRASDDLYAAGKHRGFRLLDSLAGNSRSECAKDNKGKY